MKIPAYIKSSGVVSKDGELVNSFSVNTKHPQYLLESLSCVSEVIKEFMLPKHLYPYYFIFGCFVVIKDYIYRLFK